MSDSSPSTIDIFIPRWAASGAAERADYQLFLSELYDLLGVARPEPQVADNTANAYVFEKPVPLPHGTTGRIDLYKRGCFVLEAKQGSGAWDANLRPDGGDRPAAMPEQARAVRAMLQQSTAPLDATALAAHFDAADKARLARIGELLKTLALLGQARAAAGGFVAG